jgi:hypothetical protein
MIMAEKLTLKLLAGELEALRARVGELEQVVGKLKQGATARVPAHGASVDAEQRQRMVEEEAYLIAERRGFAEGDPSQDWAVAEEKVNRMLLQGSRSSSPRKPANRNRKAASTKRTS